MSLRNKSWTIIIVVSLAAILAGFFDYTVPSNFPGASIFNALPFKQGLDLQGGAHLVYQADVSKLAFDDRDASVEGVRDVIERRVNALGVAEPVVQTNKTTTGDYRVIVELAGVFDINEAIAQIGETPLLEFRELDDSASAVVEVPATTAELLEQDTKLKNRAQGLLDRALAGEDFAQLASDNSEDPGSAQNGGDLGFVKLGDFVPEFEAVLFDENFATGQIWPELVGTEFGWHIIKKEAVRNEGEDKQIQARHILLKVDKPNLNQVNQNFVNTQLSGKQLERADLVFDSNTNEAQVSLVFDKEGEELFRRITARNIGKPVAIYLDGLPISVPIVQQEITGGSAVITGQFSILEAKTLAQRLNAGALPVPIELISQQTIGPSLGQASVEASLKAGMYGLLLVALFMLIFYRLPGLIAVVALAFYAIFVLAIFKLLGVTLTLAGIAGFILSLGLAVDANVLIFERLKEELRSGKLLSESIETGFARAWTSIRDSNISSLLTAVILYWFGSSLIRGFAVTLSIGILISMLSAIFITRSMLRLFSNTQKLNWWFGVNPDTKGNDKSQA